MCVLYVLVKGSFQNRFPLAPLEVDLVAMTMAYFLVYYGRTGAGAFAFGLGLLTDIYSAGFSGVFTFLYLIIFLGINLGSRLLDLSSVLGQIIVISLAVLAKDVLFIVFLDLFSLETTITSGVFWRFALSAFCSGLIAPILFSFLNHLEGLLERFVGRHRRAA
jgi:rod shape-determining protein MreD